MTCIRTDAWFASQLAHCRAVLAELERPHTQADIDADWYALEAPPRQANLFAPPHAGVATGGQPEPAGLAAASSTQGAGGLHEDH